MLDFGLALMMGASLSWLALRRWLQTRRLALQELRVEDPRRRSSR